MFLNVIIKNYGIMTIKNSTDFYYDTLLYNLKTHSYKISPISNWISFCKVINKNLKSKKKYAAFVTFLLTRIEEQSMEKLTIFSVESLSVSIKMVKNFVKIILQNFVLYFLIFNVWRKYGKIAHIKRRGKRCYGQTPTQ